MFHQFFSFFLFPLEAQLFANNRIETLKSISFRGLARFPWVLATPHEPLYIYIYPLNPRLSSVFRIVGLATYRSSSYETRLSSTRELVVPTSRLIDLPRFLSLSPSLYFSSERNRTNYFVRWRIEKLKKKGINSCSKFLRCY